MLFNYRVTRYTHEPLEPIYFEWVNCDEYSSGEVALPAPELELQHIDSMLEAKKALGEYTTFLNNNGDESRGFGLYIGAVINYNDIVLKFTKKRIEYTDALGVLRYIPNTALSCSVIDDYSVPQIISSDEVMSIIDNIKSLKGIHD